MTTWRTSQPGRPRSVPTAGGAPTAETPPPASASTPADHRDRHQRHDREVHDRRHERQPPERREDVGERRGLRGERDAEALREPARQRPPASPPSHVPIGFAQASRPAVASDGQAEPGVADERGVDESSSDRRRSPSAAGGSARPVPISRASSTTPAITAARTTDGEPPAATTYATTVPSTASVTTRRWRPRSSAPTSPATIAMFQPEMATTWLTPAVVKSAASVRSTRSRSPMRIPAASPASGSGSDRRERVAGGVARDLERAGGRLDQPQLARVEAARRTGAPEVGAIRVVVRRRSQAAVDLDHRAGGHDRIRGQGRGDNDLAGRRLEPEACDLVAIARRPRRLHRRGPRPAEPRGAARGRARPVPRGRGPPPVPPRYRSQ